MLLSSSVRFLADLRQPRSHIWSLFPLRYWIKQYFACSCWSQREAGAWCSSGSPERTAKPDRQPHRWGSEGSHHASPTYMGDTAPVLIYGCFSRSGTKVLLSLLRRCAAACGGDSESNFLAIPKGPPPPPGVPT